MKALVTGGHGFIASDLVDLLLERGHSVTVVDSHTYASDPENLAARAGHFMDFTVDICAPEMADILAATQPDVVFHAAAESHVDRSIHSYRQFVETNVLGTFNLLEACRRIESKPLFVYVSTDEVYGSLSDGRATEGSPLRPNNPYSVTKAAAEAAVRAAGHTHALPWLITRSCNNYGPRQHPEKLVPMCIKAALSGAPARLHGDGGCTREWIHVRDNTEALLRAAERGLPGETYNITTGCGLTNDAVAQAVFKALKLDPAVTYIDDRPGNDRRYAMTNAKLKLLGWQPQHTFASGLEHTIEWYAAHTDWWKRKAAEQNEHARS